MSGSTYGGSIISISPTPANSDLTLQQFLAISDWVAVGNVGTFGPLGAQTNMVDYPTLDTTIARRAPGITRAEDAVLEVAADPADTGQQLLRSLAGDRGNQYAIKRVQANGIVDFVRGYIMEVSRPGGGVEDFDIERFQFAPNQPPIRFVPT
jgi:hypothetical protein